jgi:restriction endonuclease S subunit
MCLSAPKAPQAPIQRAIAPVVSQAVEQVERPIELVTADKDMKKKKKIASKRGKEMLTTGLQLNTATSDSGANYSA